MMKNHFLVLIIILISSSSSLGQIKWDVKHQTNDYYEKPITEILLSNLSARSNDSICYEFNQNKECLSVVNNQSIAISNFSFDPAQKRVLLRYYSADSVVASMKIENPLFSIQLSNYILFDNSFNIFNDAKAIKNILNTLTETSKSELLSILASYNPNLAFSTNKHLSEIYTNAAIKQDEIKNFILVERPSDYSSNSGKPSEKLGGIKVTGIADGISQFMVTRAKEELCIAFFEGLKEKFIQNEDISDLFPRTVILLESIGDGIYQYQRYIDHLRRLFRSDIVTLPINLHNLLGNHPEFFKSKPDAEYLIKLSTLIWNNIRSEEHPGKIIANLPQSNLQGSNFSEVIDLLKLISLSLTNDTNSSYWIKPADLEEFNDPVFFKIFMGLMTEAVKNKVTQSLHSSSNQLYTKLNNKHEEILQNSDLWKNVFTKIVHNADQIESIINKSEGYLSTNNLRHYSESLNGILSTGGDILELMIKDSLTSSNQEEIKLLKHYTQSLSLSSEFITHLDRKEYTSAVLNFFTFYETIFQEETEKRACEKLSKSKYVFKNEILFLAQMVDAKNGASIEQIIANYALPSQSYRHKRNTKFNISLNAYLGTSLVFNKETTDLAISAPIGVGFNKGFEEWGSISLFANIIDVGAISAFRFSNDRPQIADVYLREIFSPGLHASYGIGNFPIALNLGYQAFPLLKLVGEGVNNVTITRDARWTISLVVDIPFFNLYR